MSLLFPALRPGPLLRQLSHIIVTYLSALQHFTAKHAGLLSLERLPVSTVPRTIKYKGLFFLFFVGFVGHAEPPLKVPAYRTREAMARLCKAEPDSHIQRAGAYVACADLDLYFTLLWVGDEAGARLLFQK